MSSSAADRTAVDELGRPSPPAEPQAGDCCQSGCERCVYDLYWEALDRYERVLAEWERQRLRR